MTFMMSCSFLRVDQFVETCRRVYFAVDGYSISTFIIVNAGLYYLFRENSIDEATIREKYSRYQYLCRDNLETALANLPLLLPPRAETVEALLLGVRLSP